MIKITSIKHIKKKIDCHFKLNGSEDVTVSQNRHYWETRGLDVIRDHLILIF